MGDKKRGKVAATCVSKRSQTWDVSEAWFNPSVSSSTTHAVVKVATRPKPCSPARCRCIAYKRATEARSRSVGTAKLALEADKGLTCVGSVWTGKVAVNWESSKRSNCNLETPQFKQLHRCNAASREQQSLPTEALRLLDRTYLRLLACSQTVKIKTISKPVLAERLYTEGSV